MPRKFLREIEDIRWYLDVLNLGSETNGDGVIALPYSKKIFDNIIMDVEADVLESTKGRDYNVNDIRSAVGRVLCKRLGIEL